MTAVLVINPHAAAVEDVTTDTDAPAYSITAMTLTDAEIDAAITTDELVVVPASLTDAEQLLAMKIGRLGKHPGKSTSEAVA